MHYLNNKTIIAILTGTVLLTGDYTYADENPAMTDDQTHQSVVTEQESIVQAPVLPPKKNKIPSVDNDNSSQISISEINRKINRVEALNRLKEVQIKAKELAATPNIISNGNVMGIGGVKGAVDASSLGLQLPSMQDAGFGMSEPSMISMPNEVDNNMMFPTQSKLPQQIKTPLMTINAIRMGRNHKLNAYILMNDSEIPVVEGDRIKNITIEHINPESVIIKQDGVTSKLGFTQISSVSDKSSNPTSLDAAQ